MTTGRPSWASIDLGALESNFRTTRHLAGSREVIAVVKADAYGHGAVPVARRLVELGARRLGVLALPEAVALREAGIDVSLLLMGGVHDPEQAALAGRHRLTPVLHHAAGLELVSKAARAAETVQPVQVEVDTGMRRMGVALNDAVDLITQVARNPVLRLEGVFTHLACADDPSPESSIAQLERFRAMLVRLRARRIDPGLVHADNSAALLTGKSLAEALPEAGAVRPGLMLYGARPADHLDAERQLRPVMSVRARVVALRDVGVGETVGYGGTWRPEVATRVATLPIGYEDGVPRALSNRGEVWLAGARRPIVGRVSMDYITVEVGDAPVGLGDVATFFGVADTDAPGADAPLAGARMGREIPGIPVEEAAEAAGTLAYELLVGVGRRVPRRLVESA